ncbi:uncharacterized protein PSFLO_02431 [Pseudozyma flocculosa]|uniref:Uncharacterized protein n=1 Tax=Pseudozyma flocculosa TaxID=84751 RepID=A0A5C3F0J3_9BASI|nr:uncharacterized protein PSFLO_02431 [Pseudozyma flocculosa]
MYGNGTLSPCLPRPAWPTRERLAGVACCKATDPGRRRSCGAGRSRWAAASLATAAGRTLNSRTSKASSRPQLDLARGSRGDQTVPGALILSTRALTAGSTGRMTTGPTQRTTTLPWPALHVGPGQPRTMPTLEEEEGSSHHRPGIWTSSALETTGTKADLCAASFEIGPAGATLGATRGWATGRTIGSSPGWTAMRVVRELGICHT